MARRRGGGLQMMREGEKKRVVGCILWMEDLEREGLTYGDVLAHVDGLCMKAVVSPVHNQDKYTAEDVRNWCSRHIDPDTGDVETKYTNLIPSVGMPKKPHVHLGFKSTRQMTRKECSDLLLGGLIDYPETKWAVIPDWDSYCCYMCHMYNPDKAQYSPLDVHGFGGVDLSMLMSDRDKVQELINISDIMDYAHENRYRYIHQVYNWARTIGDFNLVSTVQAKASFINMLLTSERQQRIDEALAKEKTGSQGYRE